MARCAAPEQVPPAESNSELEARLAAQALLEAADVNALAAQWEATPKALRPTPDVVGAYASRAVALNWDEPALLALEQALDQRWDDELVALYGRLPPSALPPARATWRAGATCDDSAALPARGRVALAQQQWDAADAFLHEAIAAGAGAPAWEALGELFAQREHALAAQCLAMRCACSAARQRGTGTRQRSAAACHGGRAADRGPAPVYDANEERDEFGNPRLP